MDGLFQTLLGRPIDTATQNAFVNQLANGGSRAGIAQAIYNSTEHHMDQTNALYQSILHRAPTAAELQTSVASLNAGATTQALGQQLYTSAEFQQQNNTSQSLVGTLYADITGKLPTSIQNQASVQALDNTPLNQIVQNLQNSLDALSNVVNGIFRSILQRNATTSELSSYATSLLNNSLNESSLTLTLLNSQEYSNLTIQSRVR